MGLKIAWLKPCAFILSGSLLRRRSSLATAVSIWISEEFALSIAEFIRESVLRPRLKQAGALVVYDADQRYREQCFDLATDKVRVVDASEGSIESREAALLALRDVGQPKASLEGVLIYV